MLDTYSSWRCMTSDFPFSEGEWTAKMRSNRCLLTIGAQALRNCRVNLSCNIRPDTTSPDGDSDHSLSRTQGRCFRQGLSSLSNFDCGCVCTCGVSFPSVLGHMSTGGAPRPLICFMYSTRLTVSDETAGLPRLISSHSLRHQPTRSTRTDTIEQKADASIH